MNNTQTKKEKFIKDKNTLKKLLFKEIKAKITPLLHDTGISNGWDKKGNSIGGCLRCCFVKRRNERQVGDEIPSYKVGSLTIEGFTERDEIITDSYGGGFVTIPIAKQKIEDLIKLHSFVVENRFNAL